MAITQNNYGEYIYVQLPDGTGRFERIGNKQQDFSKYTLAEDFTEFKTQTNSTFDTVLAYNTRITANEAAITDINTSIERIDATLATTVADNAKKVSDHEDRITANEANINTLIERADDTDTRVIDIETLNTTQNTRLTNVESEATSQREMIHQNAIKIVTNSNRLDSLENKTKEIDQTIVDITPAPIDDADLQSLFD